MRFSAPLLTLAGTVAGSAAAVVAYQTTASVGVAATTPAADTVQPAPVTTTSWLPCEPGWKVKGDSCVQVKEKVVVVRDLPAPAPAPAPVPAPVQAVTVPTVTSSGGQAVHQAGQQPQHHTRHADHAETQHAGEDSGSQDSSPQTEPTSDSQPEPQDAGQGD